MTELTIDERIARRREIEDAQPTYIQRHCALCQYAINALNWEQLDKLLKHCMSRDSHPEYKEWNSLALSFREIRDVLHADHECPMVHCVCKCGCTEGPFCGIIAGDLCAVCMVKEGRGYSEHGNKEECNG